MMALVCECRRSGHSPPMDLGVSGRSSAAVHHVTHCSNFAVASGSNVTATRCAESDTMAVMGAVWEVNCT